MDPNHQAPPKPGGALGRHVPALDGLRAISVFAVLLYHARLGGADSGFLGVSQFFTLSGFLVMSILLRGVDSDNLRLRTFWGRRYRRLLPASMLTLAGVVLFGVTVATEQQLDDLVSAIPAAVLQVANWHFVVTETSYVQLFAAPSPVQHFWSLAIEEQFYLLVPLALLGVRRVTRSARALVIIVTGAAVASTVWMWVLFERGASLDRLYYGTDTRASELLAGCALAAFVWWRPPTLSNRARQVVGGLAVVAFAATSTAFFTLAVTDAALYRGGFLVYSALTAVVIFSAVQEIGPVAALLRVEPLPFLGRLSYGIYLFHWPLILLLTEDRVGVAGWPLFGLQAGLSVALAWASAHILENPIRRGVAAAGDYRLPVAGVVIATALIAGGTALGTIDRQTDLAGLGETVGSAPTTVPAGPARVLIVSDGATAEWIETALRPAMTDDVEIADVIDVTPVDWVERAAEADVDAVLFEVGRTSEIDGGDDIGDEIVAALHDLDEAGVALAWRRFVPPGWPPPGLPDHPVFEALRRAVLEVAGFHVLSTNADPETVVEDLDRLTNATVDNAPRVLIIGDSIARTIGHGLERWGADGGHALVWSAGTEGCGLVNEGWIPDATGREQEAPSGCDAVVESWQTQVETFEPDIVIVSTNTFDFRERRLEGWDSRLEPGDPLFDTFLVDRYVTLVDLLSADGAQVRWILPPCGLDAFGVLTEPDGGSPLDADRLAHVRDEILAAVAAARPELEFFDLNAVLCPDGEALTEIAGVGTLRPDGIHFSAEGSRWLADTHGEELVFGALQ